MTSTDASVTALVGHMNDIETKRRLLMMCVKEAETRLAHLEDDNMASGKQSASFAEREGTLRDRICQLQTGQRVLSTQLSDGSNQLRKSEVEEPYLAGNATDLGKQVASNLLSWQSQLTRLEATQAAWAANTLTAPLLEQLRVAEEQSIALLAAEKQLVGDIASAMHDSAALISTVAQPLDALPDASHLSHQRDAIKNLILEEEGAAQKLAQGLQREVDELLERHSEFQTWVDAANATTNAAELISARLSESLAECVCRNCLLPK